MDNKDHGLGMPGIILVFISWFANVVTMSNTGTVIGIISGLLGIVYWVIKIKKELKSNEKAD